VKVNCHRLAGRSVAVRVENPENGARPNKEPERPGAKCLAPSTDPDSAKHFASCTKSPSVETILPTQPWPLRRCSTFLRCSQDLSLFFLLGRGFDDPSWIEGASAVASGMNLHVSTGPTWEAEHGNIGLPDWYAEVAPQNTTKEQQVVYICKLRSIAMEVRDICFSGVITMEQEASMLRYPVCCVQHHYGSIRAMNSGFNLMLQRYSKGNIEEMKRIVREKVCMIPETPEEISDFSLVSNSQPAPFTSFNMCPSCATSPRSPARQISALFESLAKTVDRTLVEEIRGFQLPLVGGRQ